MVAAWHHLSPDVSAVCPGVSVGDCECVFACKDFFRLCSYAFLLLFYFVGAGSAEPFGKNMLNFGPNLLSAKLYSRTRGRSVCPSR